MLDTLAYAEKLQEAGISQRQAEIQARVMYEFFQSHLATKKDVYQVQSELQQSIKDTDLKIEKVKSDLEVKIEKVKSDLEVKIEKVKSDLEVKIEKVKSDLEVKMEKIQGDIKRIELSIEQQRKEFNLRMEQLQKEFNLRMDKMEKSFTLKVGGMLIAAITILYAAMQLTEHVGDFLRKKEEQMSIQDTFNPMDSSLSWWIEDRSSCDGMEKE